MHKSTQHAGVTFAVDDVIPATELLPECRTHVAVDMLLGGMESCHDYHGLVVKVYHGTNGAELFGRGGDARCRIVACEQIEPLDWGERTDDTVGSYGPAGRIWHRIAWLPDGSWLAINLDCNMHNAPWWEQPELRAKKEALGYDYFAPICHGSAATQNKPGLNPVVALSFTELLEGLLDSAGRPYWLTPQFVGHGDAELFTRRY